MLFNHHIDNIGNEALAKLYFIKHTFKDFHYDYALEILYFILIIPKFEYTSLV